MILRCDRWLLLILLAMAPLARGAVAGFDDLRNWTGEGPHRAALVIDWSDASQSAPALAWGYRWSGAATGEQMLRAIVAADPRLFVRLSPSGPLGVALYGVGYDLNNDGALELDDGAAFDSAGVLESGPSDFAASVDPQDIYAEGWEFSGYWGYAASAVGPGAWSVAPAGLSTRVLTDGAWDAWTFSPGFASAPFPGAAEPAPAAVAPGDYNADGAIDAADYTVWRDTLGQTVAPPGAGADGDRSGVIDGADYAFWRLAFGGGGSATEGGATEDGATSGGAASGRTTPEPSALSLSALNMIALSLAALFARFDLGACLSLVHRFFNRESAS